MSADNRTGVWVNLNANTASYNDAEGDSVQQHREHPRLARGDDLLVGSNGANLISSQGATISCAASTVTTPSTAATAMTS